MTINQKTASQIQEELAQQDAAQRIEYDLSDFENLATVNAALKESQLPLSSLQEILIALHKTYETQNSEWEFTHYHEAALELYADLQEADAA